MLRFPNGPGIYLITNLVNGHRYVGSSVRLRSRRQAHLDSLRNGKHENQHLMAAWRHYGELAFVFSVLEEVRDRAQLFEREQFFLDLIRPEYNIAKIAGSCLGYRHSPESRARMSAARRGVKRRPWTEEMKREVSRVRSTPEYRKMMSLACTGRKTSPDAGAKISAAKLGKKQTKEHRERSANARRGLHRSEETKLKMSAARSEWWARKRNLERCIVN